MRFLQLLLTNAGVIDNKTNGSSKPIGTVQRTSNPEIYIGIGIILAIFAIAGIIGIIRDRKKDKEENQKNHKDEK